MSEPWIGKDYTGTGLLLLGESAYSWMEGDDVKHPSPRHAHDLVEWVLTDFPAGRFMTMLTRALTLEEWPDQARIESAWGRAAFTNYVPGSIGIGSRIRPTREMWQEAERNFPALLTSLSPRTIIVLGKELWGMMPPTTLYTLFTSQPENPSDQ
jgi:hypothetical protein